MANPTSRDTLKEYCLRKLGAPVIEINIDDDQCDDRVDEAFSWYQDYHYDAVEKVYESFQLLPSTLKFTQEIGSSNTWFTGTLTGVTSGATATAKATHSANSQWMNVNWDNGITANTGLELAAFSSGEIVNNTSSLPVGTLVTSTTESDYLFRGVMDTQYITIPDSITGVTRIFNPTTSSIGMWDIRYQMRLSDLTTFGSYLGGYQLLTYEMRMKHLQLIEELLTGEIPVRYNRHKNRLYIDWDWPNDAVEGEFIVIEATKIIDPTLFGDVYNDRWLKEFATALLKEQWGINLSKFEGVQLPGGVTLNGRAILEDARTEIERLKEQLSLQYEMPVDMMMS